MSEEENKRAATDILIDLENKVSQLTKIIEVCNQNNTFILNSVNTLRKELLHKNIQETVNQNGELNLNIGDKSVIVNKPLDMPNQTPIKQNIKVEKSTITNVSEDKGKKIPVTQKVVDEQNKDMFMSDISILDKNDEIITKTKTNSIGKWTSNLSVGEYTVKIIKTNTTKQKLEGIQKIKIDNVNAPIVLPNFILKRS